MSKHHHHHGLKAQTPKEKPTETVEANFLEDDSVAAPQGAASQQHPSEAAPTPTDSTLVGSETAEDFIVPPVKVGYPVQFFPTVLETEKLVPWAGLVVAKEGTKVGLVLFTPMGHSRYKADVPYCRRPKAGHWKQLEESTDDK